MNKIILLFAALTMIFTTTAFAETITFALGDYAPYTSPDNPKYKLAEKIVTEAFKLEGIDTKYEYYPWSRSMGQSKEGVFLGTFPWGKSEDRSEFFIIPKEAIFTSSEVFFYNPEFIGDFDWKEFSDLKKYSIGGSIDYEHVAFLKQQGLAVDVVIDEATNFKKLKGGRIQLYATNPKVAATIIEDLGITGLKFHPKTFLSQDQIILISNKRENAQRLADAFDKGLLKLKASGRYDEILNQK
jgi:polar amino acid transport system substrate-binding protein